MKNNKLNYSFSNPIPDELTLIELNRGLRVSCPAIHPKQEDVEKLRDFICRGHGDLEELPGFFAALSRARECAVMSITKDGKEVLTVGMAWGKGGGDASGLWTWLVDFRAACVQRRLGEQELNRFFQPTSYPWLALLRRSTGPRLTRPEAKALVHFSAQLVAMLSKFDLSWN